jgi:hypothetical protein
MPAALPQSAGALLADCQPFAFRVFQHVNPTESTTAELTPIRQGELRRPGKVNAAD